jgi:hypothetical protein
MDSQDKPLLLYQPMNFIIFLTFNSPLILAIGVTGMSFIFQNFKGFIYLGFLLCFCILRNYIYAMNQNSSSSTQSPIKSGHIESHDKKICNAIKYTKYGNATFSAFVFSFTIMYLCFPMFSNGGNNYLVFSSLVSYFIVDTLIKIYKNCITNMSDLFINILLGLSSGALIVTLMYAGGSGRFLFFNEVSSNKDICYRPKEQTFRCLVYQNGVQIGQI